MKAGTTEDSVRAAAGLAELLDGLAALLRYPGPERAAVAEHLLALARARRPEIAALVEAHLAEVAPLPLSGLEELYTVTFDLNPVVTLEIGWHLFGEQYERGVLLARLRAELAKAGVSEDGELPDHLTAVLRLLGRLDAEARTALVAERVAPALTKIRAALDPTPNPYRHLLAAVGALLGVPAPGEAAGT